jgi:hypothetical protein
MVFNATFNTISVISRRSFFIGGRNSSTWRKPPSGSQVTDKLNRIIVLNTPCLRGIRTHNVSGDMH